MTDITTPRKPVGSTPVAVTARLSDARVAAYLRRHPRFFDKHPELLARLQIPHEAGTTSLIERQVQQLRRRNEELSEQLQEMLQIATDNDRLFSELRRILLDLIDSRTAAQLGTRLHNLLRESFDCQQVALLRFDAPASAPWRRVAREEFDTKLPGLASSPRALAGKWRRAELRYLFGEDGLALSSAAVIPLQVNDKPLGLLALGSITASHFRSSMDTLFISFLGDVCARTLTRCERHDSP